MNRRLERSVALDAVSKESIFASFCHPSIFPPYMTLWSSSIARNVPQRGNVPIGEGRVGSLCASAITRGEIPFFDRKNLAGLDLDVADEATAPRDILELCIICPGAYAGDAEPLV
jgi:hypothetical protein